MNIQLQTDKLAVDTSSGSQVKIEGTSSYSKCTASSGSKIDIKKLKSIEANAYSSSGASIKITATNKIIADASSGSSIEYYGSPKEKTISQNSGGAVKTK